MGAFAAVEAVSILPAKLEDLGALVRFVGWFTRRTVSYFFRTLTTFHTTTKHGNYLVANGNKDSCTLDRTFFLISLLVPTTKEHLSLIGNLLVYVYVYV